MAETPKRAELYRMVTAEHTCPFGLKSLDLLKREGYEVEDHYLTDRAARDAFKAQHGVETTPQSFIDGKRIGGYDDLLAFFGKQVQDKGAPTYRPVIALLAMAAVMALATSWAALGSLVTVQAAEWFVAIAMCLLALQKLKDVEGFSTMFLNYHLLAQRWVRYGYVYPFAEALAGILMVAGAMMWLSGCRSRSRCSSARWVRYRFSRRSISTSAS
ncbi:Glutaredoxin [Paracoccus alcaliphilus]|uniref:Glutaredoxin n=1 Tax=Paracoccus alcaliphilus TaxID=34002 RepID=A0A1H8MWU5_9RHOB|nr:Glutaredoxin [Paracoccus alcaliphilus]